MPPGTLSSSLMANPPSVRIKSGRITRGNWFAVEGSRCKRASHSGFPSSSNSASQPGSFPAALRR
jgi:hypothetical protein